MDFDEDEFNDEQYEFDEEFENDDEDEYDDFQGPSFEEAQRVSVGGRSLNDRDPHDKVLIAMHVALTNEFASMMDDQDRRQVSANIIEQADQLDDLRLYNGRYLAAAYYFLRQYNKMTKKTVQVFTQQYALQCPSFTRYVAKLGIGS